MTDEPRATENRVSQGRPVHGGLKPDEFQALGLKPEEVLDFSASVSPVGPPSGVWEAIRRVDLATYPDPRCLVLRGAISHHLCEAREVTIGTECILAGNGSTEIIHLLARAYLSPPRPGTANTAFLFTPTYGEYAGACAIVGAATSCLDGRKQPGFCWDLAQAVKRIAVEKPSLVFLCNPNNPTGVLLERQDVQVLAEAAHQAGTLLVLDEAYISFAENRWDSLSLVELGGVVVVRSMTKDYALTALRIGYSVASEDVTARLNRFQPDWSVNGLAQAAALAALADTDYLPRARQVVAEAKDYLLERLTSMGFPVSPSSTNFLLVRVGEGTAWRNNLMRQGLFVRDCTSFGLPEYIRIGIRSLPDCRRLIQAIAELC